MLLYEYQVRDEFERVGQLADRLRAKFDQGAASEELLQDCDLLKSAHASLRRVLPEEVIAGNFSRHVAWMEKRLREDAPAACRGDIEDICKLDLPVLERAFRDWCAAPKHYDSELSAKVGSLVLHRHLDSAIRKAFVILTDRLRRTFDVGNIDGRDLVNAVFGSRGRMSGRIPEPEREAIRNLLDGLFGLFRNRFGHQNANAEWHDTEAVLAMINWCLKTLEGYPPLGGVVASTRP